MFRAGRWCVVLRAVGRFLAQPLTRYALAWVLALGVVGTVVAADWNYFTRFDADGNPVRRDGNDGHCSIDFGGQWTMGRMLVLGQGQYLYERRHLRAMLRDSYPVDDQEPGRAADNSDAEKMMFWFMGYDDQAVPNRWGSCLSPLAGASGLETAVLAAAGQQTTWRPEEITKAVRTVGGPLYPPINAFLMYPLALFSPQTGYRIHQVVDVGVMLLAAWGITRLSPGRLWLPVVLALLAAYPGFQGTHLLGQNSLLTLLILAWGWVLIARGRPGWGGLVWGLLAFKPVWALSFFLVLLLSQRWRGCLAMAAAGLLQIALTLPVVGVHTWREWLHIGKAASELYKIDGNWVGFSRDLIGIPRRWMLDWNLPGSERDTFEANAAGWALLLGVFALLVTVSLWKRRQVRAVSGPPAAFVLLGGWLCCYHFMYYDVLLTFLPLMLLFSESGWRLPRDVLAPVPLLWQARLLRPWTAGRAGAGGGQFHVATGEVAALWLPSPPVYGWVVNSVPLLSLVLLLAIENPLRGVFEMPDLGTPWNTFCLLALWLWCGWRVIRTPDPAAGPDVPLPQSALPGLLHAAEVNGLPVTTAPAR